MLVDCLVQKKNLCRPWSSITYVVHFSIALVQLVWLRILNMTVCFILDQQRKRIWTAFSNCQPPPTSGSRTSEHCHSERSSADWRRPIAVTLVSSLCSSTLWSNATGFGSVSRRPAPWVWTPKAKDSSWPVSHVRPGKETLNFQTFFSFDLVCQQILIDPGKIPIDLRLSWHENGRPRSASA